MELKPLMSLCRVQQAVSEAHVGEASRSDFSEIWPPTASVCILETALRPAVGRALPPLHRSCGAAAVIWPLHFLPARSAASFGHQLLREARLTTPLTTVECLFRNENDN